VSGRKPRPTRSPVLAQGGLPRCPDHLDALARKEWRRFARPLFEAGILTVADRAAFAAYCQSYSKWAEAERKRRETPALIRTPAGYVQQSPWISIANKQLELMGRYMSELGITPTARARVPQTELERAKEPIIVIRSYVDPKDTSNAREDLESFDNDRIIELDDRV
jgi:P27 family predicted phage terminase small subunit